MREELRKIDAQKPNTSEIESQQSQLINELKKKAPLSSIDQIYQSLSKETQVMLDENRSIINKSLQHFEVEVKASIEKKANSVEVFNMLSKKLDEGVFHITMEDTASRKDLESLSLSVQEAILANGSKLDIRDFERRNNEVNCCLDEFNKEIAAKAGLKEVLDVVKNKAEIDDVNKALVEIHGELEIKCSLEQVY